MKWGETASVGSWAGAATNGGLNFALLSNSCGIRPGFDHRQDTPLFAGVPVLGIIMPVTFGADDADAPTRGTANAYVTNANGSIAHAWANSPSGIPQNDGAPCGTGNYTFGGGHGIGVCGAQMAQAEDVNQGDATWDRDTMSWNSIPAQSNGSRGTQRQANTWTCNYDCNKYPFTH